MAINQSNNRGEKKNSKQAIDNQLERMNHPTTIAATSDSSRNALPRCWNQLNIDFIESITPFLEASEISYLHRTCHAWLHIAQHIRHPHLTFHTPLYPSNTDVLLNLGHSLIRRHIMKLMMNQTLMDSPDELELIRSNLPKLQRLVCSIACTEPVLIDHPVFVFPTQLRELRLTFDVTYKSTRNLVNEWLVGVGSLTLLNNLTLIIPEGRDMMGHPILSSINLQPLTRLVDSLTHLRLDVPFTMDHIMVVRQLVNLISLTIDRHLSHQKLAVLLAEPVPFSLEIFDYFPYRISSQDAPLFKRLIHLTTMDISYSDSDEYPTDLSFLSQMVHLKDLIVKLENPANLVESLYANPCQSLTSLTLGQSKNLSDHGLNRIFASRSMPMPVLKILHLSCLPHITSLAFMAQLSALEGFYLTSCPSIESKELVHLRYLPHLYHIDLRSAWPEYAWSPDSHPLDSNTRASMDPKSDSFERAWFPALRTFLV